MRKIKSCIFLHLTLLFTVQVFAFDAIPPDKTLFELDLIVDDYSENEVIVATSQSPALSNGLIKKTLTAKTLSINQHLGSIFQVIDYEINKVAVIQNQNFDRMQNS